MMTFDTKRTTTQLPQVLGGALELPWILLLGQRSEVFAWDPENGGKQMDISHTVADDAKSIIYFITISSTYNTHIRYNGDSSQLI